MKPTGWLEYAKAMVPALFYLICYLLYIFSYICFYAPNFEYWNIAILVIPTFIGIVFVFPFIGLCHLLYVLFLFFGGNKKRVKPHLVSVLCSLVLTILSHGTIRLGYFPSL